MSKLVEGLDYYIDERSGFFILTAHFLLNRGSCCSCKCKHCPYYPKYIKGNVNIEKKENQDKPS
jgi:hypothetical protein